jgi:hypothetical protein
MRTKLIIRIIIIIIIIVVLITNKERKKEKKALDVPSPNENIRVATSAPALPAAAEMPCAWLRTPTNSEWELTNIQKKN